MLIFKFMLFSSSISFFFYLGPLFYLFSIDSFLSMEDNPPHFSQAIYLVIYMGHYYYSPEWLEKGTRKVKFMECGNDQKNSRNSIKFTMEKAIPFFWSDLTIPGLVLWQRNARMFFRLQDNLLSVFLVFKYCNSAE